MLVTANDPPARCLGHEPRGLAMGKSLSRKSFKFVLSSGRSRLVSYRD